MPSQNTILNSLILTMTCNVKKILNSKVKYFPRLLVHEPSGWKRIFFAKIKLFDFLHIVLIATHTGIMCV